MLRFLSFPRRLVSSFEVISKHSRTSYIPSQLVLLVAAFASSTSLLYAASTEHDDSDDLMTITNWSGTHEVTPKHLYSPGTKQELIDIVNSAHSKKQKIRPVGSALSPNGIAFSEESMVSMANFDRILSVDTKTGIVVVEPGARVEQIVKAIQPHGLTLQNYASIKEQQLGGFYQVSAHGTGARIPPVDEQVVGMKLLTPAKGEIVLSNRDNPELFKIARVALGAMGFVTELSIQCVPRHLLLEKTFVVSQDELKKNHQTYLNSFKHVRYMWIPLTSYVVVVGSNPIDASNRAKIEKEMRTANTDEALVPLRSLVRSLISEHILSDAEIKSMNFAQLRGKALMCDALNPAHVKRVNDAEAEFWKLSEGDRLDWSENILGFECGDQQWVCEVTHRVTPGKDDDLQFVEDILKLIVSHRIPAPGPIEQRWTAASTSKLSPAFGNPNEDLFSWVGIIMYLPNAGDVTVADERRRITEKFSEYRDLCFPLWQKYRAYEHWAKVEIPQKAHIMVQLPQRMSEKYPVREFNQRRKELDPHNILGNALIDTLFK